MKEKLYIIENFLAIGTMPFYFVRAERLELSRREALDPKSSVSTNSTTPAFEFANIAISSNTTIIHLTICYICKNFFHDLI